MNMVRKLACGVMCFAAMIASATTTTNFDFFVEYIQSSGRLKLHRRRESEFQRQVPKTGPLGRRPIQVRLELREH